jgi:hypothetical protein
MKSTITSLAVFAVFATIFAASPALANADDDAWIAKCVKDNADQGQTAPVIASYCQCMNGKMSTSETLSVTAWEKTHKTEADACGTAAGWVGK